jgi:hypothetical protein
MIFRSQSPISPSVDIAFDGVAVNYLSISKIQLDLTENQHDLVRIVVGGIPPEAITDYINVPVSLSWYQGNAGHEFRGYVVYTEPTYKNNKGIINNSPFQLTTLYCFGASFDMRGKHADMWDNLTIKSLVAEIAKRYQLSYSVPDDDFLFYRRTQDGISDWEFLVEIADALGYSVTMHGTHLHVFDRYKAIGRQTSYHVLKTANNRNALRIEPGVILSFDGVFGQVTPVGTSNTDDIQSLDNEGNLISAQTENRDSGSGKPISSRFTDQISVSITTPDYVRRNLEARAKHRFPFGARVELTGTSGIKPGGIVSIDGFSGKFDGIWYVTKAIHTLTLDKYFTEVELLKDSTNDEEFRITPVRQMGEVPDSVLRESAWKASTQMEEIYG